MHPYDDSEEIRKEAASLYRLLLDGNISRDDARELANILGKRVANNRNDIIQREIEKGIRIIEHDGSPEGSLVAVREK